MSPVVRAGSNRGFRRSTEVGQAVAIEFGPGRGNLPCMAVQPLENAGRPDEPAAKIALGTCAWSCEDWRGSFYPETLPQTQWLGWYGRHLNAVEVDSTFYHPPTPRVAAHWLESTPDGFAFSVKLSRVITHEQRLRDSGPLLRTFLEALEPLRPKLGCVLIQLPPAFSPGSDEEALRQSVPVRRLAFSEGGAFARTAPRLLGVGRYRTACA